MAQGARIRPEQDPYVLLVSDRPTERTALERGIALVMDCRTVGAGDVLPPGLPHVVVVDLHAERLAATEAAIAARVAGRPVPRLVLTRGDAVPPPAADRRSMPATTPRKTVLAGIFAMIEAATRAGEARARRLNGRSEAATAIVAELFDSAALGAGLQQADVDRGTDVVLEAVSEAGINAWLDVVWRYDMGVYQHTLSVAGYAAAFGGQIGLNRGDLHRLAKAALLHDIGKSRIPADILNKPGPLSPEEIRLMRMHPGIGADLLVAQGGFEPAILDVVRHHHEKLDGSGYPDGLAGEAVADLVRIIAVCDVFSALTERRSYRTPLTSQAALATMFRMSGHLDPVLLNAFVPVTHQGGLAVAG
ncbi:hypothetical protein MPOCJGCO_1742 [Methylobacterium trifolii]|uniref:HD domain-containing protein n=1 Tax=Methylobacterium trifolii TaxID=1003092 RepID=A0ABQ4U1C0_9HYPH|nr:hypothetical protein MPOCJGCO_1742 [Methylobacterium trifolii]